MLGPEKRLMATDSAPKLRVSLWRDFRPGRTLAYQPGGDADARLFHRHDQLQEEVFAWEVGDALLNGITDDDLRAGLRGSLFDVFAVSISPSERPCSKLSSFFEAAEVALVSGSAEWADSEDLAAEDEPDPYRVNMLLAFYSQMRWLYEMFKDEPGVSISVR
jgi:hypothetical protein